MSIKITVGHEVAEDQILLKDCAIGDVIKLESGVCAVVIHGAFISSHCTSCGKGLFLLGNRVDNDWFQIGETSAIGAALGEGEGRITENLGRLNITID